MFKDNSIKTAEQAAYHFHRKNNFKFEMDEILGEAYLTMCEAKETFQEGHGAKIETWVGKIVNQELNRKFYMRTENSSVFTENNIKKEETDDNYLERLSPNTELDPERLVSSKERIENFSEVGRTIIEMIFNQKNCYNWKSKIKQAVKKELRAKGYNWNKIQQGFQELREFANELA